MVVVCRTVWGGALVLRAVLFSGCGELVDKPLEDIAPVPESDVESVIVSELCARFDECECAAARYGLAGASCDEAATQLVKSWVGGARGLEYDGRCMAKSPWTDCLGLRQDENRCSRQCQIYSGSASIGEQCERFGPYMSSCQSGLFCDVDGVCRDECDALKAGLAGHRCGSSKGDHTECAAGLVCEGGQCVDAAQLGSSCGPQPCEAGTWCSEGECVASFPPGAMCPLTPDCEGDQCGIDGACTSGLCEGGICLSNQARACKEFSW